MPGEEKLWEAVILQAVQCLDAPPKKVPEGLCETDRKQRIVRANGRERERDDAYRFFRGKGNFSLACQGAGLDPGYVQDVIGKKYGGIR